jgi:NAD(P)-dependent dehydrogenase (short-subunit alcohol dehydrogenase family)
MAGLVDGKVALVTGAAAGIGRASALAFAAEGAQVVVSDVNAEGGAETVGLIRAAGHEAEFIACDIADAKQVAALIAGTVERYGRLDCAHNNAGIGGGQRWLADTPRENWDRVLAVNLTGSWLCLAEEIRHMAAAGGGAIVATSSASSVLGIARTGTYAATKAAINQLVRSAASEYAEVGVRVNAVLPGPIRTELVARAMAEDPDLEGHLLASVPMARVGEPREVADAVVWLCSDRASFITGACLSVDGGQVLR